MEKIQEYYNDFHFNMENEGLAAKTIDRHLYHLKKVIFPAIGNIEARKLTFEETALVRRYARERLSGNTTERRVILTLRKYFAFIQKHREAMNFDWRDIAIPKSTRQDPSSLTLEEINLIFQQLDLNNFHDLRLRLYLEMLFRGGLRPSEALMIDRFTDLNLRDELVLIPDIKKGNKRWVKMPGIKPVAEAYLRMREDQLRQLFIGGKHLHLVKPLDLEGVRGQLRRFRKKLRRAGFHKDVYPYIFRKSFCTEQIRNGIDIKSVQHTMRHTNPATTLMYYSVLEKEQAEREKNNFLSKVNFSLGELAQPTQ